MSKHLPIFHVAILSVARFVFFCAGLKSADTPRSPRRRKKGEDAVDAVPLPDELLTSLVSERAELVEWAEAGFVGKFRPWPR